MNRIYHENDILDGDEEISEYLKSSIPTVQKKLKDAPFISDFLPRKKIRVGALIEYLEKKKAGTG